MQKQTHAKSIWVLTLGRRARLMCPFSPKWFVYDARDKRPRVNGPGIGYVGPGDLVLSAGSEAEGEKVSISPHLTTPVSFIAGAAKILAMQK